MTTQHGITIRMAVKGIRSQARNTLGVRVIRLDEGDTVRDAVILEPPIEGLVGEGSGEKPGRADKATPEAPEPPADEDEAEDEEGEEPRKKPGKEDSDDDTEDDNASPAQAR